MKKKIALFLMLALLLSGCSMEEMKFAPLSEGEGESSAQQIQADEPVQPVEVTAVQLSAMEKALQGASILNQRALNDIDYLVVIQTLVGLPEGSALSLTAKVNDKAYNCTTLEQFTNRLYCVGAPPPAAQTAKVQIFSTGNPQPAFEGEFTAEGVPSKNPPAAQGTAMASNTADDPVTPYATEGPTGGGGEQAGNGMTSLQPGGAMGGGMEEMGGGIAPTPQP